MLSTDTTTNKDILYKLKDINAGGKNSTFLQSFIVLWYFLGFFCFKPELHLKVVDPGFLIGGDTNPI